jgi:dihydrofolate reductase
MGRVIYSINVSLDGYVAGPEGLTAWPTFDDEVHAWFNEQARALDAALYGRRMWEVMSGYWPGAEDDPAGSGVSREFARIWNRMPKVVFSSSLDRADHGARLVSGDVAAALENLRGEFGGDLGGGGPDLAGRFIRRGLVDEYRLVVHPLVLGGGTPCWDRLDDPLRLRLVEARPFPTGAEARTYVPA